MVRVEKPETTEQKKLVSQFLKEGTSIPPFRHANFDFLS
jgi:hypothetical protein